MSVKSTARLILFSLGIALLLAGLFFHTESLASPGPAADATPTRDRLAEPTLPATPSQADVGSQVYWLSCMPCHGDFGQGLTDEFRQVYPPEDQNCWESGCHGARPYDGGFTLPKTIPALIGPQTLAKFSNAAQLHAFVLAAMPFWKPGSLTDEQSWQVTAFLLRQNGLWTNNVELDAENASRVKIGRGKLPPAIPTAPQLSRLPLVPAVAGLFGLGAFLTFLLYRKRKS